MVGRKLSLERKNRSKSISDDIVLKIRDLVVKMPGEEVKGFNLDVKKGEIVGIGGLAGQGKLGIANGIMGIYPAKGNVEFEGEPLELKDRKGVGLLLDCSIELNTVFTSMQIHNDFLIKLGPFKLKHTRKIRSHTKKMIKDLDIRCISYTQNVGSLSGGNQQKVCLARALTQNPKLLLVSEPTRGIDVGAKKIVLDLLRKLNEEQGMTIIMTSSELAELRSICDRIAIVCDGKLEGILSPDAPDADFGLMMSGSKVNSQDGGDING